MCSTNTYYLQRIVHVWLARIAWFFTEKGREYEQRRNVKSEIVWVKSKQNSQAKERSKTIIWFQFSTSPFISKWYCHLRKKSSQHNDLSLRKFVFTKMSYSLWNTNVCSSAHQKCLFASPNKEVWLVCLLYQAFFLRKSAASWMWTNDPDETLLKIHKWTSLVEQTLLIISARLVYNTFKYISHQNSVKLRAQCNSMTTSFKEVLFQNHKPKLLWQYKLK